MGWIDPRTGLAARPFSILPCVLNIRNGKISRTDHGFGQFWHKRYQIKLTGVQATPEEVVQIWRKDFPSFWPHGNLFYAPLAGIEDGQVALLKLAIPGGRRPFLATGVIIENVTPTTFTYTAIAGHPIAGSMSFCAFMQDGITIARADACLRASDPLFEVAIRLTGKKEDRFWQLTLENLARAFGTEGLYSFEAKCLDRHLHWKKFGNLLDNAAIRSMVYNFTIPMRFLYYAFKPGKLS